MLDGAATACGGRLERALLISKRGHVPTRPRLNTEIIEAGHPIPDADSLRAGARLLTFLAEAPADVGLLFLISGGASSLVEVVPQGVTLADLQRVNQWLLGSGLPIAQMNAIRVSLSCIKGGYLREQVNTQAVRVLLISDVAGDDPAVIGSGLLYPPSHRVEDFPSALPSWLQDLMQQVQSPAVQDSPEPIATTIVARLDQALDAVVNHALQQGYAVQRCSERLQGDAVAAGQRIAATLISGAPGLTVWGGETTVCLPAHPGQGGRCQQLALAAAQQLAGQQEIFLLAAGTDGNDGPGDVAGACVDGQTLERAGLAGFDAAHALQQADAGRFLEAAGDLLYTGPTGTNVTDVVIGLKLAAV